MYGNSGAFLTNSKFINHNNHIFFSPSSNAFMELFNKCLELIINVLKRQKERIFFKSTFIIFMMCNEYMNRLFFI